MINITIYLTGKKMKELIAYHVITDRPMYKGQIITFDTHYNGVFRRVEEKSDNVKDIYANPSKYNAENLEHHVRVALRELALEKIRKQNFPDYPSRMACLYVSDSLQEAEKWAKLFIEWGRPTYTIVKLRIQGNVFIGDAINCFDAVICEQENLKMAERYWLNLPNLSGVAPIKEILVNGNIEVLDIVKEINANLY